MLFTPELPITAFVDPRPLYHLWRHHQFYCQIEKTVNTWNNLLIRHISCVVANRIKAEDMQASHKSQSNYTHCCLWFSFLIPDCLFSLQHNNIPEIFLVFLVFWVGHRNNYNAHLWHQTCTGAKDLLNHIQMHTGMIQSIMLIRTKQKVIQNFCVLLSGRSYISARFSTIQV